METKLKEPDQIIDELEKKLRKIGDDFDLTFNKWHDDVSLRRFYLNRDDGTAVCWIETNFSHLYIDRKAGSILKEKINEVFHELGNEYGEFYKNMED